MLVNSTSSARGISRTLRRDGDDSRSPPSRRLRGGNEEARFLDDLPGKSNLDFLADFGVLLSVGDVLDCASTFFSPTIGIDRFTLRLLSNCFLSSPCKRTSALEVLRASCDNFSDSVRAIVL